MKFKPRPGARHPPWYAVRTCRIFNFNTSTTNTERFVGTDQCDSRPRARTGARCERPSPPPPPRARPDLASRGRGCGNRLRRNTRHENNRNSECTSEARRDAVGASETRINTRLFTYGVRARGCVAGRGAIACNPHAAITALYYNFILTWTRSNNIYSYNWYYIIVVYKSRQLKQGTVHNKPAKLIIQQCASQVPI